MLGFFNFLSIVFVTQHLLLMISLLFACIIITVATIILLNLIKKNRLHNLQEEIKKNIADLICEIAICETPEELDEVYQQPQFQAHLKKYLQTHFERTVLIKELAETCKKISGNAESNIQWLFKKTGLEKDLLRQLKRKHWSDKAEAIQHLAALKQNNNLRKIFYYTNHANLLVRMEAQVAVVNLTGFKGLRFLNVISHPITPWQQLELLNELSQQTPDEFEKLGNWLQSENESVRDFSLRLTGIYQRYEQYDAVVANLFHSSNLICRQALKTISKIYNEETAPLLISLFPKYEKNEQLLIVNILKDIGSENDLPFLKTILSHPDNEYKLAASKTIYFISAVEFDNATMDFDQTSFPWEIIIPQIKTELAR